MSFRETYGSLFMQLYASSELSQLNCIEPWKDSLLYKGADKMNGPSAWKEGRLGSLKATITLKRGIHLLTVKNFLYRAFRLYLQQVAFVNRDNFITADPKYLVELML